MILRNNYIPQSQIQPLLSPNRHPLTLDCRVMISNRKLQHINCVIPANQLMGGLYLGDIITIHKPQILHQNKIEGILSCLNSQQYSQLKMNSSVYIKNITVSDSLDCQIKAKFEECYQFIQHFRKLRKNVLVHCHAGVSRSVTIVCAYLMKKCFLNNEEALNLVRSKRQRAKPNKNFLIQLMKYYEELNQQRNQNVKNQNQKDNKQQNYQSLQQSINLSQSKISKVSKINNSYEITTSDSNIKELSQLNNKYRTEFSRVKQIKQIKEIKSIKEMSPQIIKKSLYESQKLTNHSTIQRSNQKGQNSKYFEGKKKSIKETLNKFISKQTLKKKTENSKSIHSPFELRNIPSPKKPKQNIPEKIINNQETFKYRQYNKFNQSQVYTLQNTYQNFDNYYYPREIKPSIASIYRIPPTNYINIPQNNCINIPQSIQRSRVEFYYN